ncbi:RNA ligase [Serratia phage 92A1]|nr:RNA ligase [Serratia phage 92A1]
MFKKYSSIENHYREVYVNSLKMQGFTKPNVIWVAREKLHGTNFSALVTKESLTWCKRSGPIEPGESFYNHTVVANRIEGQIKAGTKKFLDEGAKVVQVYGELAGEGVMSQVKYGQKDFYIFEILVDEVPLSDTEVVVFCVDNGLKISPLIKLGTFDTLFNMDREFESRVNDYSHMFETAPALAGTLTWHPEAPNGNTAEGVVLKPLTPLFDKHGDRVILKLKSDTFKEKEKATRVKVSEPLSEQDQEALDIMCSYVNKARFDNVMSKGDYTIKQVGMVIGLLAKDALEDINKDNEFTLDEPKRVSKEFNRVVSELIRDNIEVFK